MAKRKQTDEQTPEPGGRRTAPIQVEKDLARMAAVIASYRGVTQSEVCSAALRPHLTTQYRLIQEEMAKKLQEEKGGGGR